MSGAGPAPMTGSGGDHEHPARPGHRVTGALRFVRPTQRPTATSASLRLGILLAVVGGFLDAYTYISRSGVFANAQTANVVLLGVEASHRSWSAALRHVPPIIAFVAGVITAETLSRPRFTRWIRRPARVAIGFEILALLVVGALPHTVADEIVTVTVSFVASLQVAMFRTLERWPYNTAMTTGNLRSIAQASYLAVLDHDADSAEQAAKLGAIVAAFLVGAVVGGLATFNLGDRAAWIPAAVLVGALGLFIVDERTHPSPQTD